MFVGRAPMLAILVRRESVANQVNQLALRRPDREFKWGCRRIRTTNDFGSCPRNSRFDPFDDAPPSQASVSLHTCVQRSGNAVLDLPDFIKCNPTEFEGPPFDFSVSP